MDDDARRTLLQKMGRESARNDNIQVAVREDIKFIKKVAYIVLPNESRKSINDAIYDAVSMKNNPIEGLRLAFPESVFRSMCFYTRGQQTLLLEMINKPATTGLWKAFKKKYGKERGHITMAFHLKGQKSPWVITNQRTGYVPRLGDDLHGCIIIHVRGESMPVYVMPLNIYMKEEENE